MRFTNQEYLDALQDDLVFPVILFELATDTPIRLHSSLGIIEYNSNTYIGVGKFGGIDKLNESQFLQPENITVALSGFPVPAGETLDDIEYKNRRATLRLMLLNKETILQIGHTLPLFSGEADVLTVSYGKTVSYSLTISNELAAWKEGSNQLWSHETQTELYPGDLGLEFLTRLENEELTW